MKTKALVMVLVGATAAGLVLGQWAAAPGKKPVAAVMAWSDPTPPMGLAAAVVPPAQPAAAAPQTLAWSDLVPKDWDPLKKYRDMNLDALSDSDPRAIELLRRMRESWDNAPTNRELDGRPVRIAGYIVPLDEGNGGLVRFLLVPYYGACIHTPPPPSNQIIDVTPRSPARFRMMSPVWVRGTLRTLHSDTVLGASGYRLSAESVEWYTPGLDRGLK